MAWLAVHDKKAADNRFLPLLPLIARGSDDDRNFVKRAVNWALIQIGKRSAGLNETATKTGIEIQEMSSRSTRRIASDALRELTSEKVRGKLRG